jgi:hypothetical protein
MSKKKNKPSTLRSTCCGAEITSITSPDEIDKIGCTCYCVCTKCGEPCDIYSKPRAVWNINPKTRIVPNKKKKDWNKLSKQEVKKYLQEEDF